MCVCVCVCVCTYSFHCLLCCNCVCFLSGYVLLYLCPLCTPLSSHCHVSCMLWISLQTVEKTHLEKRLSVYAEREQTLQEEILQLTQQVTQLEGELSAQRERGRGRGTEQSTTQSPNETAKHDVSEAFIQQQPTTSAVEPVSDSLQQQRDNAKTVLDFSLQSLLSSLSARNDKLAVEVMKHSKVWCLYVHLCVVRSAGGVNCMYGEGEGREKGGGRGRGCETQSGPTVQYCYYMGKIRHIMWEGFPLTPPLPHILKWLTLCI